MSSVDKALYVQSGEAKLKKVGKDMTLYVKDQKAIHVLNPTAYLIYEAMKDPISFDELVFVVKEVTQGDVKDIQEDLKETLDLFLKYNIIKPVE